MTELKTHLNCEEGLYEVTMITDSKDNYQLVQYLIRSLIDGKYCTVEATSTNCPKGIVFGV
jgi:uncharacterized protein (DUF39 family)